ncbi:MAG: hypothetical protein IJA34_00460 [Lachnospiraceae bacterium]|nr:hypothetical protein [Lachnospiraceae bacterium]
MLIVNGNASKETKFNVGDEVYIAKSMELTLFCQRCLGAGYKRENSIPCECTECSGKGYKEITKWISLVNPAIIEDIRIKVNASDIQVKYKIRHYGKSLHRTEENLFRSLEEAEEFCESQNVITTEMNIDDIEVPECWLKTYPCAEKIDARMKELKTYGKFKNIIIVDKNNVILDGYTTYVLAKGLGFKTIEVIVKEN